MIRIIEHNKKIKEKTKKEKQQKGKKRNRKKEIEKKEKQKECTYLGGSDSLNGPTGPKKLKYEADGGAGGRGSACCQRLPSRQRRFPVLLCMKLTVVSMDDQIGVPAHQQSGRYRSIIISRAVSSCLSFSIGSTFGTSKVTLLPQPYRVGPWATATPLRCLRDLQGKK